MRPLAPFVAIILLGVGACSGSDEPVPAAKPTATQSVAEGVPDGTPVPEVLSQFRCEPDDETGAWRASGVVQNPTKTSVGYHVTVHVGPADGGAAAAATKPVGTVKPGGSVTFQLDDVPATGDDGPCHVQVLALR